MSSHDPETSSRSPPLPSKLLFPFAAQPDIIRANQKDIYYQRVLEVQVQDAYRLLLGNFIGVRTPNHHLERELSTFSNLCYFCLTTLPGTQTLGEEYCDIMQAHGKSGTFPTARRRAVLVFFQVLFPYLFARAHAELRRRARRGISRRPAYGEQQPQPQLQQEPASGLRALLPKIEAFAKSYGRNIHSAVFYFYGAYYSLSKRVADIRYVFMSQPNPGEERIGYEVLGVLILLQFAIQAYQYGKIKLNDADGKASADIVDEEGRDVYEEQADPSLVGLTTKQILARKCTLCLSPRKETTATPCGHLFCWTCVVEWCRNKPECPLCRQHVTLPHLLPIYNY